MMVVCALVAIVFFATVQAAIPNRSKEQLHADATHISIGTVTAIYTEEVKEGQWSKTSGVVEIHVSKLEKGDKIEVGDSVYARFWNEAWIGKGDPPPFGSGHHLPKKCDTVRVYLKKANGRYDALLPNGFETITNSPESKTAP